MRAGALAPAAAPARRADRIRVLHVISTLLPGGTEMAALRLIRNLDPDRYLFKVAYLQGEPALAREFESAGAEVIGLGLRRKADPGCLIRLWRLIRKQRIDLVHTHMDLADHYGAVAGRLAGARAIVSSKQNADEFRTRRTWKRYPFLALERLAYALADATIVVSEGLVDFLARVEHLPTGKMTVIGNGVDAALAARAPAAPEARRRLGLSEDGPLVGTVGRLAAQKGQIHLLRAFPAIRSEFPGAGLLIAGDGPERQTLEDEARGLGIAAGVRLLGHRTDVPTVLGALDVFVLPSLWEGLPQALLEAMAVGVPVVAARAVGVAEIVRHERTGLLVAAGDSGALADGVLRLLRDRDLARRLGAAGRDEVLRGHSLESVAGRVDALYRRVLRSDA